MSEHMIISEDKVSTWLTRVDVIFLRMENKSWQNVWFGVATLFENFVTNNQQNVNM